MKQTYIVLNNIQNILHLEGTIKAKKSKVNKDVFLQTLKEYRQAFRFES